jgi:epsilon-lactone hydrolase
VKGRSQWIVERAVAAGVDARADVWMGMPHGFPASIGRLKAAAQALDTIGAFLAERLKVSKPFGDVRAGALKSPSA